MAAHTLSALAGRKETALREELVTQASRVALNRSVCGLHFPVDSIAGTMLCTTLFEYLLRKAGVGGPASAVRQFKLPGHCNPDYPQWPAPLVPCWTQGHPSAAEKKEWEALVRAAAPLSYLPNTGASGPPKPTMTPVQWLWSKAAAEWV